MISCHPGGYGRETNQDIIGPVVPESSRLIAFSRVIIIGIDPRIGKIPPGTQHLILAGSSGVGNGVIMTFEVAGGRRRGGCLGPCQCGSKQDKADYYAIYGHYDYVIKLKGTNSRASPPIKREYRTAEHRMSTRKIKDPTVAELLCGNG